MKRKLLFLAATIIFLGITSQNELSAQAKEKNQRGNCPAVNVPYSQDFESAITPAIPICTTLENAGLGNNWETSSVPNGDFNTKYLRYAWNTENPANAWFYTQGINLTAGTTYKISYDYGSDSGGYYPESLRVAYGTEPNSAAMATELANHSSILTGEVAINNVVVFSPPSDGIYYFGFNSYSEADMYYLYVDNIKVEVSSGEPPLDDCGTFFIGEFAVANNITSGNAIAVANDFVVPANTNFTISKIRPLLLTTANIAEDFGAFEIKILEDNASTPGSTVVQTFTGITPSSIVLRDETLANFKTYWVTLDLGDYMLPVSGTDKHYWISLSGTSINSQSLYWTGYGYTAGSETASNYQSIDNGATWQQVSESGANFENIWTVNSACSILGVSNSELVKLTYYPNPVNDVLNIESKSGIKNVTAYNMTGQQVLNSSIISKNGQVNVSSLLSGVYLFKIELESGKVETFKVIKK